MYVWFRKTINLFLIIFLKVFCNNWRCGTSVKVETKTEEKEEDLTLWHKFLINFISKFFSSFEKSIHLHFIFCKSFIDKKWFIIWIIKMLIRFLRLNFLPEFLLFRFLFMLEKFHAVSICIFSGIRMSITSSNSAVCTLAVYYWVFVFGQSLQFFLISIR